MAFWWKPLPFRVKLEVMSVLSHSELERLTPTERLSLISQLWDSLEDEELQLTAEQAAELDRRMETLEEDERDGITWEALKVELQQRRA
ncbi:MAG TPA: addiction module protein [Acidobacteriaceae bacterium]|nr:addiction module protein [Acidobacteriaceae bacterium]